MRTDPTHRTLALVAACLLATPALADPSSSSRHAGVLMPVPSLATDAARPKPILWDRLERSAIERPVKSRKPVLPPDVPAESQERAGKR